MMSSKTKKTSQKKQKKPPELLLREKKTDEKEKYSNLRLNEKEHPKELLKAQFKKIKVKELHESLSSVVNPEVKIKALGFWCKKLQDLEESIKENRKFGLYDFNESDESDFCFERKKKKLKQKVVKQKFMKRRQPVITNYKKPAKKNEAPEPEKKMKEIHRQSLCREQIILSKERKKLTEKGEKFTFSTEMPSLGITSTPAINKVNLIGASNFLFLSPIIKEGAKCCSSVNQCLPPNEKVIDNDLLTATLNQETVKVETRLKRISCRKVLRNGKVL